ncbi:pre-peptidase C-terminal domain-containing protein, partial [Roseiconus lacunae]|uniref:pre-peptidase C-terminal domain-containing protein n=1 Tax=Roseiconus lacunae TaxID=2605694 RepID=UPI001E42525D
DGMFDTADDQVMLLSVGRSGLDFNFEVLDGPLLPGDYRLTMTPTLTDTLGNRLAASENSNANELVVNGSGETLNASGELEGWLEVIGSDWQQRSSDPESFDGISYFFPGVGPSAELSQRIDISPFSDDIDLGAQLFSFSGWVRSFEQENPDLTRIVVEFRSSDDEILDVFDSGNSSNVANWKEVDFTRFAPIGTRSLLIRLIATRNSGSNNDGYFDGLSMRTRAPTLVSDSFTQTFRVEASDNFELESSGNRGFSTATELTLVADALGTGLYQTEMYGRGSTDPVNDRDYFKFSGLAGDRVAINADYLSGSGFDPYITLYASDGTYLTADDDSGPGGTAFISGFELPEDGDYFIEVHDDSSNRSGDYQVRVDLARGVDMETDANYSNNGLNSSADPLNLVDAGNTRSATIAGSIMGAEATTRDLDRFRLGLLNAGTQVDLSVSLPEWSTLDPILEVIDSNGNLVLDSDADPGVFSGIIDTDGTYYASVRNQSTVFAGSLYSFNSTNQSWTLSEADAVAAGGHLAAITSLEEQRFIVDNFGEYTYWIGLNDATSEDAFTWSSGESVSFDYWSGDSPASAGNSGSRDYTYIGTTDGRWILSQDSYNIASLIETD